MATETMFVWVNLKTIKTKCEFVFDIKMIFSFFFFFYKMQKSEQDSVTATESSLKTMNLLPNEHEAGR